MTMYNGHTKPMVLSIDDDLNISSIIRWMLTKKNYDVVTVDSGEKALTRLRGWKPDLILVDVNMPGMDGFQVCSKIQNDKDLSCIPVIFVTALKEEQNKAMAFSCGAVDYVTKPFDEEQLFSKIMKHLETSQRWKSKKKQDFSKGKRYIDFLQFKEFLFSRLKVNVNLKKRFVRLSPRGVYFLPNYLKIDQRRLAQLMAQYLGLRYVSGVNMGNIVLGALPTSFCRDHLVVSTLEHKKMRYTVSNPFDEDMLEGLGRIHPSDQPFELTMTEPENVQILFNS